MLEQISPRRRGLLDAARGRNMISRPAVAKNPERAGAGDLPNLARLQRKVHEKRRLLNIRAARIPLIHVAGRSRYFVPLRVLIGEVFIEFLKDLGRQSGRHLIADLLQARPNVAKENALATAVLSDGLGAHIDVDTTRQRKSDYQRRRH